MFGELGPRLKGGLNQLLAYFSGTTTTLKTEVGKDLTITPGDASYQVSTNLYPGRSLTLQGGSVGGSGAGNGGTATLTGGTCGTGYTAGATTVTGGAGYVGGAVTVQGGAATAGTGGLATVRGGTGPIGGGVTISTPPQGAITIATDAMGGGNVNGGALAISTGNISDAGAPGAISITAGSNTSGVGYNKSGAAISLTAGNGGATNSTGGAVTLTAGNGAGTGNGGDISLAPGAGGASGVKGNILTKAGVCDQAYSYQQPVTGFSITIGAGIQTLILDPAGTLATGTITMPAAPADGQQIRMTSTQTITALTVSANTGQSITNAPTTIAPNLTGAQGYEYIYRLANTTWYRLQ